MSQVPLSKTSNTTLLAVNTSVLEGLGLLSSYFGFNKMLGQLYGALLLSPEPLSLDDLMEQLSISKASVSTNLRTMEHMGLVREAWVRDDRRKYYRAETDFWRIVSYVLSSRELRDVNQAINVLTENHANLQVAMPAMSEDDSALAAHYCEQLQQIAEFFRLAQTILNALIQRAEDASAPAAARAVHLDIE